MNRNPPCSEKAERGVLGAMMLEPSKVLGLCSINGIVSDSFHVLAHRHLFGVLQQMHSEHVPIDALTVFECLQKSGRLDLIGGYAFLEGLIDGTPTAAHAEYYIGFIHEKHLLRKIIDEAKSTIDRCYSETDEDAESILRRTEGAFRDIGKESSATGTFNLGRPIDGFNEMKAKADAGEKTAVFNMRDYLPSFDMEINEGDLIGIFANTGVGKTRVAHNLPYHIRSKNFCMVDLELSLSTLSERYTAMRNGISVRAVKERLRDGRELIPPDMQNIFLQKIRGCTVQKIRERVDQIEQVIQQRVHVVGVDYIGLMAGAGKAYERTSNNVEEFKEYVSDEGRVGIITSQVTRPEDRKEGMFECPSPFSAKNSGSIENSCQEIFGVWRPTNDRRMMKARCLKYSHDDPPPMDVDLIADDLIITESRKGASYEER